MEGALAKAAEAAFGRLSAVEKQAVQQVFLQLVRPAASGEESGGGRRSLNSGPGRRRW